MNMNKLMAVTAVCVAVVFLPAYADTVEWNGEAGNGSLSDGGNWVGGVAPVAGDALDFSSIASGVHRARSALATFSFCFSVSFHPFRWPPFCIRSKS